MMAEFETCPWCQGSFPKVDGPTHEYTESSPGCWAAFTELLARDYENFQELRDLHRLVVDSYAVQHPGQPSRRSTRSVWMHLISLNNALDHDMPSAESWRLAMQAVESQRNLCWLEPPSFEGTLTVADALQADDLAEHEQLVRQWAESVRAAWADTFDAEVRPVLGNS